MGISDIMKKWEEENSAEKANNEAEKEIIPAQEEEENINIVVTKEDMSEYYNQCHNYVYHVFATQWLLRNGLYYQIDELQIGYDVEEKAIIIPIDATHYERYFIN